jgi:hypothetical protein
MRPLLLATFAIAVTAATMTFSTEDANAVVCAKSVVRAGCVGSRGAVIVRRPPCRWVWVNGARVSRCVR